MIFDQIYWKLQDFVDYCLDLLNDDWRWSIIRFLYDHELTDICLTDAFFWSIGRGNSIFEVSRCSQCDRYCRYRNGEAKP